MVLGEIISKGLSVRDTEKLINKYQDNKPGQNNTKSSSTDAKKSSSKSADIKKIEQQLKELLGVKVDLQYKENGSGEIKIPFKTDRELNYILDLLQSLEDLD